MSTKDTTVDGVTPSKSTTTNRDGATPGPWTVEGDAIDGLITTPYVKDEIIICTGIRTPNDARLIAQAPAMLAFIREWRTAIDGGSAVKGSWSKQFDDEAAVILARVDGGSAGSTNFGGGAEAGNNKEGL